MIADELTRHPTESVERADVLLALDEVLVSRPFRTSNQCSGLLRYIVEHTLAGEDNLLRERVIGAELFGRRPDYETSEDPVVRLRVSEVRKKLAQYYLSAPNKRAVQIEIPSGSYRATFHWNAETPSTEALKDADTFSEEISATPLPALPLDLAVQPETIGVKLPAALSTSKNRTKKAIQVTVAVSLLLAVIGGIALLRASSKERAFRSFWAPWFSSQKPVIISVGSNAVYRLQYDYVARYSKEHGLEGQGQEFYIPFGKDDSVSGNQLFPAYNSYVALGDVNSVSDVVAALTREKKGFEERFPDDISFAELRDTPAVLIGGFNNSMTLELSKHLEFVMRGGNEIDDTLNPNRKWLLKVSEDAHETADYAIITRIVERNGDSPIISVAGLGQYGTLAAAQVICSPTLIQLVTAKLPKDWADKNLQAVIRVNVVDFKPSVSEVVAFRSW